MHYGEGCIKWCEEQQSEKVREERVKVTFCTK
jgi:hypothetical protein